MSAGSVWNRTATCWGWQLVCRFAGIMTEERLP